MTTLVLLVLASIGIVIASERHPVTRAAMQKLTRAHSSNTCRSFILDVFILLPLIGLLVELLARRIKKADNQAFFVVVVSWIVMASGILIQKDLFLLLSLCIYFPFLPALLYKKLVWWKMNQTPFYYTALAIFLGISGSLYFDYLNFSSLTPLLGHSEAWGGNHFMWNSGIEVLGLKPLLNTTVPTYRNFWDFWNLLALILLGPVYVWIMLEPRTWILIRIYTRLRGLLFGYTPKQTGISALFFERKTH